MKTSKRLFNVGALTVMFSMAIMAGDQTAYGTESASADFTSSTIQTSNMAIEPIKYFAWNSYYKVWRIENSGGGFKGIFTVPFSGSYNLTVTHLSSASNGCQGGGYSPINIRVNGNTVVSDYDPAANHDASHGWVTDTWTINAVAGTNSILFVAGPQCTHYWIQSINISAGSVQAMYADFTSSTIQTSKMTINRGQCFSWNAYYKVWLIGCQNGSLTGTFTVPSAGQYNLTVTHLSSASANCPDGGYSPVTIRVNGDAVVSNYSPPSHGWITETWTINCNAGSNSIQWVADALCTNYWIQRIEIVPPL